MSEKTAIHLRWRFSLTSLFVFMTAFAVVIGYHAHWIRARHAVLQRAYHLVPGRAPGLLWFLREQGYAEICVEYSDPSKPVTALEERIESYRIAELFPEARTVYVSNPLYGISR